MSRKEKTQRAFEKALREVESGKYTNREEAAVANGISPATFFNYLKKHKEGTLDNISVAQTTSNPIPKSVRRDHNGDIINENNILRNKLSELQNKVDKLSKELIDAILAKR